MIGRADPPPVKMVRAALRDLQLAPSSERQLQDAIEERFRRRGLLFEREFETGAGPVDFCVNGFGVEVKIKGARAALIRQIDRYLGEDSLRGVVVVTTKSTLTRMPVDLRGKPVFVLHLVGAAFG